MAGAPVTGIGSAGNGTYLFVKPKNGWKNRTETAKLTPSRGTNLGLGYAVSIIDSTVTVGARFRTNDNGAVYVYGKPFSGWRSMTETARLTVPPKFNVLGFSVSADNDGRSIVGGAPGWQDGIGQGAVDLFVRPASGWKTSSRSNATLTASDGKAQDGLGYSVSAIANVIVSGAPYARIGASTKEGAAYVFGY